MAGEVLFVFVAGMTVGASVVCWWLARIHVAEQVSRDAELVLAVRHLMESSYRDRAESIDPMINEKDRT